VLWHHRGSVDTHNRKTLSMNIISQASSTELFYMIASTTKDIMSNTAALWIPIFAVLFAVMIIYIFIDIAQQVRQ